MVRGPSAKAPDGREVGATRGVLSTLLSLCRQEGATHVACATDHVVRSFRNELFAGYKTEIGVPEDLLAQFPSRTARGDARPAQEDDGYPGLPGWGERSAAAVLAHYGSIEAVPARASTWAVKVRGAERLAATLAVPSCATSARASASTDLPSAYSVGSEPHGARLGAGAG